MADRSSVLREFLIKLGFNVDPSGIKNFIGATSRVTRVALETGAAVTAAAAAVEAYVQVFASNMEKLYYSSKRTGAAVENIQALEFGARQIGVSADDARQSLEAMAATVRMNPGLRSLLNNIVGHDTAQQDTAHSLVEMVQSLNARYPHFIGARLAGMFGMDEKTFFMLSREAPKLLAAEEKYHQMQKRAGVDASAAAEASVEYMNALRGIWSQVMILGQALAIALLPKMREFVGWLSPVIEKFTQWVNQNRALLASRLDDFLRGLVGWLEKIDFDKVFKALDDGVKKIDRFVKAMGGWENVGLAVVAVMAGPLLLAITNLGIAITTLMANPAVLAFAAMVGSAALLYKALNYTGNNPEPLTDEEKARLTKSGKIGGLGPAGGGAPTIGPKGFPIETPAERLAAQVYRLRMLQNELAARHADYGTDTEQGRGYVQREIENTQQDIAKMMGPTPPRSHAAAYAPGSYPSPVTINQKTEINVHGASDAKGVARGVLNGQTSVNSQLVRDFTSKVN